MSLFVSVSCVAPCYIANHAWCYFAYVTVRVAAAEKHRCMQNRHETLNQKHRCACRLKQTKAQMHADLRRAAARAQGAGSLLAGFLALSHRP